MIPLFVYGSLMWDTKFDRFKRAPAVLSGYKFSYCVESVKSRGTISRPGFFAGIYPCKAAKTVGWLLAGPLRMHHKIYRREGKLYYIRLVKTSHGWAYTYIPRRYTHLSPKEFSHRYSAKGTAGSSRQYVLSTEEAIRQVRPQVRRKR